MIKSNSHACCVGNSQTGEKEYQRSPPTVVKVLSPTSVFPGWGSNKETRNPQESDTEGQWDLITGLAQDWEKTRDSTLRGHKQKLVCPRT